MPTKISSSARGKNNFVYYLMGKNKTDHLSLSKFKLSIN
jgi:hypothetical protein